jgi:hypothetical protein
MDIPESLLTVAARYKQLQLDANKRGGPTSTLQEHKPLEHALESQRTCDAAELDCL